MLSDEEREALEILNNTEWDGFMITIKNLIEKQSKEIEELKEKNKLLQENYSSAHEDINWFCENYTSNDKIKAKIEEIDFMIKEINQGHLQKYTVGELLGAKRFLQSLLEKE